MRGKKKCENCKKWSDDTELHRIDGKLTQLCRTCWINPDSAPVVGYQVECGAIRETILDAADARDAAVKAMERSTAEELGALLRVRKRPHGPWEYIDPMALVGKGVSNG